VRMRRTSVNSAAASVIKATTQVNGKGQNSTLRHVKTLLQILTKIGMGDNVVDVTPHAKFYRAPFGVLSPHIRDFSYHSVTIFLTLFWVLAIRL